MISLKLHSRMKISIQQQVREKKHENPLISMKNGILKIIEHVSVPR